MRSLATKPEILSYNGLRLFYLNKIIYVNHDQVGNRKTIKFIFCDNAVMLHPHMSAALNWHLGDKAVFRFTCMNCFFYNALNFFSSSS